jgi:hypothetical protein
MTGEIMNALQQGIETREWVERRALSMHIGGSGDNASMTVNLERCTPRVQ